MNGARLTNIEFRGMVGPVGWADSVALARQLQARSRRVLVRCRPPQAGEDLLLGRVRPVVRFELFRLCLPGDDDRSGGAWWLCHMTSS